MSSSRPTIADNFDIVVEPLTLERHINSIRRFLDAVNPETGYLGD
ncbi:hypothetical protein QMK17_13365 [Rhodococcus sp. G-MC3]|nr:hypothetical protein [Rhodococcus sp. G-MC3]MDJ0394316.1 hypothetical protein [Rhodococcus sp. G-MC3]